MEYWLGFKVFSGFINCSRFISVFFVNFISLLIEGPLKKCLFRRQSETNQKHWKICVIVINEWKWKNELTGKKGSTRSCQYVGKSFTAVPDAAFKWIDSKGTTFFKRFPLRMESIQQINNHLILLCELYSFVYISLTRSRRKFMTLWVLIWICTVNVRCLKYQKVETKSKTNRKKGNWNRSKDMQWIAFVPWML